MPALLFQSTHLQEVRLYACCIKSAPKLVSIHAPTRGATSILMQQVKPQMVSIHAPTRGATESIFFNVYPFCCFNPRTYKRCDPVTFGNVTKMFEFQSTHLQEVRPETCGVTEGAVKVSIHAPTRGATSASS